MNPMRWTLAHMAVVLWTASHLGAVDHGTGEPPSLTLDQAIQTAVSGHPGLRQAELDIGAAAARVKRARSSYFPRLDAGGLAKQGLSGSGNLFGLHGLASSPEPDDMAFSVNLYQDVFDFKRTKHESRARRAELVYFKETLLAEEATLILQVKREYYSALKAQKLISLAQERIQERTLTIRQAEALYRAQLRSKLDVNLAGVQLSRAQLGLVRARNSLRQALAHLNTAMGEQTTQGYALQEQEILAESPAPLDTLLADSLQERAELAAVDARIQAGEEWVRRAKRAKYPRIMAMFSGGWTRFAELTLSRLLFGGFGIQLPLLTGGRLQADLDETRLVLEKTKATREELIRAIGLQVTKSHSDLMTALESAKTAEQGVGQAREAARLARIRYKNELAAFVEWTIAQTALAVVENEQAQALYDYKIAESELDFAIGRRF